MQQWRNDKPIKLEHQWVGHEYISPHLPMAVIASEDNLFADHNGFDFDQIKKAIEAHKRVNLYVVQAPSANKRPRTYFFGPHPIGYVKDLKFILLF
jgi:hypothetical protein